VSDTPASARGLRDDPTGTVLEGKYRFDRLIASGGMAEVWKGWAIKLEREIAIKRLHPHLTTDAGLVERFQLEAKLAVKVHHDSIVKVYDICSADDGTEAIVMELVRGQTLRQHLDRHGALDPAEAAKVTAIVADVLQMAHEAGLVHRDVKPGNILLCDGGDLKVADFGIAKAAQGQDLTAEGTMLGTAKYLAPEQVRGGPVDGRTDVYALGVVLYEMLTGRPPFEGDTDAATALARLHRPPPRPRQLRASIPEALDEITMRAMALEPEDRYQTATAMRADVLGWSRTGGGPGGDATVMSAEPTSFGEVPVPIPTEEAPPTGHDAAEPGERRWVLPALVILLIVVALGVGGLLIGQALSDSGVFEGDDTPSGDGEASADAGPLPIADVIPFDPAGDGAENDAGADQAIDGDPANGWVTEGYDNPIARLKPGVGIVLNLEGPAALDQLQVVSGNTAWAAEVYVVDGAPPADLAGWGEPVATGSDLGADASFDLGGTEGSSVLLWLTDLGPQGDDGKFRGRVGEVTVLGAAG
jgi:serine/threonine-protein kinase